MSAVFYTYEGCSEINETLALNLLLVVRKQSIYAYGVQVI